MPTVKELQELLRAKGLKVSGRKDELVARLAGVSIAQSGVDKCSGKTCPVDKVCNPETGRCVIATGKIGKKISVKPASPPRRSSTPPPVVKKSKKVKKVKKVSKPPIISENVLKKLLIMEKAYENANQAVPAKY